MSDIVIGIDLGTTNSCAAYYMNGTVKILENNEGSRTTPSYIFFRENFQCIVGQYAKYMADSKPEWGIYEIKRLVGRKFSDPSVQKNLQYFPFKVKSDKDIPIVSIDQPNGTIQKTPEELCTMILKKIKEDIERKLGHQIDKAVVTVPAYFNVSQREVTLAAANKAGFTVLKLLNEPTAAALCYYAENDCEQENYSLVYDLGGGTFDVAILKRNKNAIQTICVDGDSHLGGHDFDNLIIDHVCKILVKKYGCNPNSQRRTMRRIYSHCEEAKKRLSTMTDTSIILNGIIKNHDIIEIVLTRKQLEDMFQKLFEKTIEIVDNALKGCNLSKADIKEVILSGGSSRIPKLQSMLSDYFGGKKLNRFVNPDECVAEGAALQAAMLSTNPKQQITAFQITDVVSLSLGVSDFVDSMAFLIKRNTPIPTSHASPWYTVHNRQKSIRFDVYEGERLNAKKNYYLGTMVISNLTPAPPGQAEVTLTMSVDQNGILAVRAAEKCSANVKDLEILYTRGFRSDGEVNNALRDAEDNKDEDERFQEFVYGKEYLLNYCTGAKYNFKKKKLIGSFKELYELCGKMEAVGITMDVEEQVKLNVMIEQIEERCEPVVQKYDFEFMPDRDNLNE